VWKFSIEEPPCVGFPNDIGFGVLVQTTLTTVAGDGALPSDQTNVRGWPGYHTHWTPLPQVKLS
jgi:hypothetical protein